MMAEMNEWELSKENVQPLRQGRNMASLTAGLQPQAERIQRIRDEKHVFEAELRTYNGDDPLDNWYKYIRWAEQTFPKGGTESNLTTIVERCIRQFRDEEKYRNDDRYIYAWIKMADFCNEPLDIFTFMYDQNIGCEVSAFYIAWAMLYEQLGNSKKADAVFVKGLNKKARPVETLKCRHEEFQKRVFRQTMEGQEFSNPEEQGLPESWVTGDGQRQDQGQRQVLSQLRATGKKQTAPVSRTGNAILGSAGVLGGAIPKMTKQVPSRGVQVYQDENQVPSTLPPQTNEWTTIPKQTVTNKENEKKAGKWTSQKMGKTGINIPVSALSSVRQPAFTVHMDEVDSTMRTPIKKPELDKQVLSVRKEKPTSTVEYLRSMTANPNKNEKPMYCKEKIYGGVEEFSFEELRAFKWKKEQDRKREQEGIKELEESRQRLEEERRLLLEEAERVKNERLKIQQEEHMLIEDTRRKLQEQRVRLEQERKKELERHQELIDESIRRIQEEMSVSNSFSSRLQTHDGGHHGNTENIPPEMMAGLQNSKARQDSIIASRQDNLNISNRSTTSQSHQDSMNTSNRTPTSLSNTRSNPSSGERSHQALFGSASPTVNTKEALMLVRGMFNSSIEANKTTIEEESEMDQQDDMPTLPSGQGSSAPPFQIFDENQASTGSQSSNQRGAPFTIFDENQSQQQNAIQKPCSAPFVIYDETAEKKQEKNTVPFKDEDYSSPSRQTNTQMVTSPYSSVTALNDRPQSQSGTQRTGLRKKTGPLFEDDNMESIESHARDDITLAPLGSHLSFAEAAKFASTPFNKSRDLDETSKTLNESGLEMMDTQSKPAEEKTENQTNSSLTSSSNQALKGLSPIMEGSSEDSGASSKSGYQTLTSQHIPNLSTIDGTPGNAELPEDTMSLLQLKLDEANSSNTHMIDISAYMPPDMDEKTENILSMSICVYDPKDPFDIEMKEEILTDLKRPLSLYDNYEQSDYCLPDIRKGALITLGSHTYRIVAKIGQGGFAKVYVVENDDDMTFDLGEAESVYHALKVEEPVQHWEFYICNEVQRRLATLNDPVDIRPAMMNVQQGCFFKNGSCLITDYHPMGTLLDLANLSKKVQAENISHILESLTAYMTIELLHMMEKLHKCHIIHGDVKPDNFLFLGLPGLRNTTDPQKVFHGTKRFTQLIDFGQSIDMTKYKSGTTFMTKVTTKCFQCTEMKTNRPWTYQTDYFGLAGTIHVLIFKQYMNVYQTNGEWRMTSSFNRHWNTDLWKKLFHILLNVPSCDELPDLSEIRQEFEEYFVEKLLMTYNGKYEQFNTVVQRERPQNTL